MTRYVVLFIAICSLTSCKTLPWTDENQFTGRLKYSTKDGTNIEMGLLPPDVPFDDGIMGP